MGQKETYGLWLYLLVGILSLGVLTSFAQLIIGIRSAVDSPEAYAKVIVELFIIAGQVYLLVLFYKRRKTFPKYFTILNTIFCLIAIMGNLHHIGAVIGILISMCAWPAYLFMGTKPKKVFIG